MFDACNLITVASFLSFVGIVLWAYGLRRKGAFDEAANLPFRDDFDDQATEKRDV